MDPKVFLKALSVQLEFWAFSVAVQFCQHTINRVWLLSLFFQHPPQKVLLKDCLW